MVDDEIAVRDPTDQAAMPERDATLVGKVLEHGHTAKSREGQRRIANRTRWVENRPRMAGDDDSSPLRGVAEVTRIDPYSDTRHDGPRQMLDVAGTTRTYVGPVASAAPERSDINGRVWASDESRFEERGFIAAGGMGDVWRVYDRLMGRTLAMKVLAERLRSDGHARARFLNETSITARLQHPGIVAVHSAGELNDGRPFFTMKEVRGRTFSEHIQDLHRIDANDSAAQTRALRRLVDALVRACEAIAYAHSTGIIHRDIKPSNLMVGRFGEVQVMDWGLACKAPDRATGETNAAAKQQVGTPPYMPPERTRGLANAGYTGDVYALGAVLYQTLTGEHPYAGERWVLAALKNGPPKPLEAYGASSARPIPLCVVCERAMHRRPTERYADAGRLARALQDWLDDAQRYDRALALVVEADEQWTRDSGRGGIANLRQQIVSLRRQADDMLRDVAPHDPLNQKVPAWQLQDCAAKLEHEAAVKEVEWQQTLHAALNEVPELAAAHARLADYYHDQLKRAEARREANQVKRAETLLKVHDRGRYASYLRGDAELTLRTAPAGARVTLHRYEEVNRRLIAQRVDEPRMTPLTDVTLRWGSYLLLIEAEGHHVVRYPVSLERGGAWTGVRPGRTGDEQLWLPPVGALESDDVYIPGGWFVSGGDPNAVESLALGRVWVDGMIMKRHPVTCGEYLAYLDALVQTGRADEANIRVPKRPLGTASSGRSTEPIWPRNAEGLFELDPAWPVAAHERWPVTLIDWHDAGAYAAWYSEQTGASWRLPSELEWEKAARGVDGRHLPWGDFFDATFACVLESQDSETTMLTPGPIDAFPKDESPYGVRGMVGNVRDWCIDRWERKGPPVVDDVLQWRRPDDGDTGLRSARGGAWIASAARGRPASRYVARPDYLWAGLGFRLVRSIAASSG